MLTFGIVTFIIGVVLLIIGSMAAEDGNSLNILPGLIVTAVGLIIILALTGGTLW